MKKIVRIIQLVFPIIILVAVAFLFFSRLFFPKLSLFITPDFGQSDILHGYYPIKYQLWLDLHQNKLPIWSSLEATGYPLFADGQIGALFFINIVLFRFLPFVYSINLGYVVAFFIFGFGTYIFCKELDIKTIPSLFAGVTAMLSGFNIGQITHISLLQAASVFPLLLYFSERILKHRSWKDFLLFALVLSQQIFAGHQQMTTYSLIGIGLYFLFRLLTDFVSKKKRIFFVLSRFVYISLSGGLAIIMSLALLIPSIELFKVSGSRTNIDILSQFPYPPSNLLTFLNPYYFGNPANGTYQVFNSNWGIFWENNGYIGLLPLICLGLSLFLLKNKNIKIFLSLFFFSLLLVLGKYSPLYFLYNFPPLNMFRVPSRFLLLTDFSLAVLSALVLNTVFSKCIKYRVLMNGIGFFLIAAQIVNIFYYFYNYHPIENGQKLLDAPLTVQYLSKKVNTGRLYTVEDLNAWNDIFLKKGWVKPEQYEEFKSGVIEHSNLFYHIPKANYFVQFPTKRMTIVNQLYSIEPVDKTNGQYRLATSSAKLMGANNIKYLLLPNDLNIVNLSVNKKFDKYTIYENPYAVSRANLVYEVKYVSTLGEIIDYINSEKYKPDRVAIVENENLLLKSKIDGVPIKNSITWIKQNNTNINLEVLTNKPALLVLADTYYPGWEANIDGKKTEIYPVNISQRGVYVKAGFHNIQFIYSPNSLRWGFVISIISYIVVLAFIIQLEKVAKK